MVCRRRQHGVPSPRWNPPPPAPLQPAAQDSIRLRTGNPLYVFAGAGGPGNLLGMERKDTPAPRDHLSTFSEAGGGGISGVALAGVSRGGRWGPSSLARMQGWWLLLAERVRGWEKVNWGGGVQILLGKG